MEIKVLGCHGGESSRHRTSSFLIDERLAVDAGAVTSTLSLEDQKKVQQVLISHAHLDHVRDLATLADNRCQQDGPTLDVFGTQETIDDLRAHLFNDKVWPDFSRIMTSQGPTMRFVPISREAPTMVGDYQVRAVEVSHTIDSSGFLIEGAEGVIAYSGDTGPTERLWELLSQEEKLKALVMEVSFPNHHHALASVSGHHTPESLALDLKKLHNHPHLPVLLFHIKPLFEAMVEKELTRVKQAELEVCRLGDRFRF